MIDTLKQFFEYWGRIFKTAQGLQKRLIVAVFFFALFIASFFVKDYASGIQWVESFKHTFAYTIVQCIIGAISLGWGLLWLPFAFHRKLEDELKALQKSIRADETSFLEIDGSFTRTKLDEVQLMVRIKNNHPTKTANNVTLHLMEMQCDKSHGPKPPIDFPLEDDRRVSIQPGGTRSYLLFYASWRMVDDKPNHVVLFFSKNQDNPRATLLLGSGRLVVVRITADDMFPSDQTFVMIVGNTSSDGFKIQPLVAEPESPSGTRVGLGLNL